MKRREYNESVEFANLTTVAVYGSLRKGLGLHPRVAHCPCLGQGVLKGGDLYSYRAFPALVLRDDPRQTVVVEVYAVDPRTLAILDGIEGAYDRDVVTIHMDDGSTRSALIYTQTDEDVRGLPHVPDGDWTEYKKQMDNERRSAGMGTDGWGPDGYGSQDIFARA